MEVIDHIHGVYRSYSLWNVVATSIKVTVNISTPSIYNYSFKPKKYNIHFETTVFNSKMQYPVQTTTIESNSLIDIKEA